CGDAAALGALLTQDAREIASVDAGDGHDAFVAQVGWQHTLRTEVGSRDGHVPHDKSGGEHAARFAVLVVDAGIADMRIREGNDLTAIAGISQDFLVARHGRIENYLGNRRAWRSYRHTPKHGTICQSQNCRSGKLGPFGKNGWQQSDTPKNFENWC